MIAGCIDGMRADACGDCERRDACSHLFSEVFGGAARAQRPPPGGEAGPRDITRTIFRAIFGEVAKAVERNFENARHEAVARGAEAPPRRAAARKPPPAAAPAAEPGRFQREVEGHLEPLLASGPIGIDSVARELGYSRQTLYRRLKAEGVTFEEVLDGLRRKLALREEAAKLLDATGLQDLLTGSFGECAIVGSYALDLMTWRDLDIYVPAERTELTRFVDTLPRLHAAFAQAGRTLFRAVFNDEWAKSRGDYGRGYDWGLRAAAGEGPVWKIDLWGWDRATFARKLEAAEALKRRLAGADRSLILGLKQEAQRLPGFRDNVTSFDIYRFVLAGAGTTLGELTDFGAAPHASGR